MAIRDHVLLTDGGRDDTVQAIAQMLTRDPLAAEGIAIRLGPLTDEQLRLVSADMAAAPLGKEHAAYERSLARIAVVAQAQAAMGHGA